MAEAQTSMGSSVDKTTEALIRQIDAAQKSATEMRNAANSGAAGWMNAVPSYKEAADKNQTEVLDSLSNEIESFARTGEFNVERLAGSILATMTQLAAKLAVEELFGGLLGGAGGSGGSGGGGFVGALTSAFAAAEVGLTSSPTAVNDGPMVSPSMFRHAPQYAEGTANTSGIPAILHDNEAVVPLSKGRKIPVEMGSAGSAGGGSTIDFRPICHIQTPDTDSFRKSQKQISAEGPAAAQKALQSNG